LKNQNTSGFADIFFVYGAVNDLPVAGDWNADGIDSIGIYRGGTFYLRNSNTAGFADMQFSMGNPGDQPIAGDWDGLP
jgi:lysyl endopeptidase